MRLALPATINADGLLPFIGLLDSVQAEQVIELDFAHLRRVSPAALVAFTASINAWRSEGRTIVEHRLASCPILPYLQRMDVLSACGFSLPETFTRHEARGRFVPLRTIDHRVNKMGDEMALCVAPGGDDGEHTLAGLYDLVWYVLTEMGNNVRQHSGGQGFAAAQVGQSEGMVRIAIADNGCGILQSFREAGLSWSKTLDDRAAILKALEPRVTSKGSPNNEGVGLTLTSQMAELAEAWMLIVSGRGVVRIIPGKERSIEACLLPGTARYAGTLIALTFRQDCVSNYPQLLDAAKRKSGLLRRPENRGRFEA
jgi:hypothetical protein